MTKTYVAHAHRLDLSHTPQSGKRVAIHFSDHEFSTDDDGEQKFIEGHNLFGCGQIKIKPSKAEGLKADAVRLRNIANEADAKAKEAEAMPKPEQKPKSDK